MLSVVSMLSMLSISLISSMLSTSLRSSVNSGSGMAGAGVSGVEASISSEVSGVGRSARFVDAGGSWGVVSAGVSIAGGWVSVEDTGAGGRVDSTAERVLQ